MKSFLTVVLAGILLLAGSITAIYGGVFLFPEFMEQYYTDVFRTDEDRAWLFYLHPFVLSAALWWVWKTLGEKLKGGLLQRAVLFGATYALVATLPTMWITFSAIKVSLSMVASWTGFGFLQASVAGILFGLMSKEK